MSSRAQEIFVKTMYGTAPKRTDALDDIRKIDQAIADIRSGKTPLTKAGVDNIEKAIESLERGDTGFRKTDARPTDGPADFEAAVERIQKRDLKLKQTDCMARARRMHPDLYEKYQAESDVITAMNEQIAKADLETRNAPEVRSFEERCDTIQKRDGLSRLEALRKAARSMSPAEFDAYRHALED